jgi:hypothetical protein
LHASVDTVKTLRKAADKMLAARIKEAAERRAKEQVRLAQGGLTGQRLGKYVVREGEVDVQLGEELSESLRGLQVRAVQFLLGTIIVLSIFDGCGCSPKVTCSEIGSSVCNSAR